MDNRQKIAVLGIRHQFYYFNRARDRATVCLLIQDNKIIARGISLCSHKDQFVKRIGKAKALGRAVQAMERGTDPENLLKGSVIGGVSGTIPNLKGEVRPEPTQYEEKMLAVRV